MRARMAIAISKTPVMLREVILRDKPDELLAISDKATVPVLVYQSQAIEESLDIMRWALTRHDPQKWLETADDLLIAQTDRAFKFHLDRYKYASRYEGENAIAHRQKGLIFIKYLNERLYDQPYLAGPTPGFVDIAIFPFVRQFRKVDTNWFEALPIMKVQQWLAGLTGDAVFTSIMKKYPIWKDTRIEQQFPDFQVLA